MARDRQRARQARRDKRSGRRDEPSPPAREPGGNGVPDPRPIHRENVPGPVEHIGEVDEFEAELVAGAEGEVAEDPDAIERQAVTAAPEPGPGGGSESMARSATVPATGRGGSRFLNFLRACWAELQRVQWPDRRQVAQATAVVLGFVIVAGAFLGFADFVAERLVDLII